MPPIPPSTSLRTSRDQSKMPPVWVTASGTWQTRVKKARYYLQRTAWAPRREEGGENALLIVMCNLRRYHRLGASFALVMVKEHYNQRCFDCRGTIRPWSDAEVLHKYREAGKRGMYPTLGVEDPRAKQKASAQALRKEVRAYLRKYTEPGGACTPSALREAFIANRGGIPVKPKAFGSAVVAVTGIQSTSPFGTRVYRGFHLIEVGLPIRKEESRKQKAA